MRIMIRIFRIVLMLPISFLYWVIILIRNKLYDRGILKIEKINCRVISVGNLALGGTGKTSLVIHLCRILKEREIPTVVLMRGYKGMSSSKKPFIVCDGTKLFGNVKQCGDEAFLIAKSAKVPVIIGKDRITSAALAMEKFQPNLILLDDGFQYRKLHRDFDIVLLSELNSMNLFPAGYLREPFSSLKRSSLIAITKYYSNDFIQFIKSRALNKKIIALNYYISGWRKADKIYPSDSIRNKKVIIFSAIANFYYFEMQIKQLGALVVYKKSFPDHYYFKKSDVEKILSLEKKLTADLIVMTEKDAVKLEEFNLKDENIWIAIQSIFIPDEEEFIDEILGNSLH